VKLPVALVGAAVLIAVAPARAHVGAQVASAKFLSPAAPVVTHADATDAVAPYAVAVADSSFAIRWDDGDVDPTGRFVFYWLDHNPTYAVTANDIEATLGTRVDDAINDNGGYFVSCSCSPDMGVVCPTEPRDPNGNCSNGLTWATASLPAGTYWLVAVNNDPPFHTYSAADAPIRVSHGGAPPPPAAVIVRPDGQGAWSTTYRLQWLAAATPPLTFDLTYGDENADPLHADRPLVSGYQPSLDSNGTSYGYDWNLAALPNGAYFVRLRVTDGNGVSASTDSYYAVTVYHQSAAPPDMAHPPKHGCAVAAAPGGGAAAATTLVLTGLALAVAVYFARRRGRSG
jgi:hypothetical protein